VVCGRLPIKKIAKIEISRKKIAEKMRGITENCGLKKINAIRT
jgi:hypothetical protein